MTPSPVIDSGVFSGEYQTPAKPYQVRKDHLFTMLGKVAVSLTLVSAVSIGSVGETDAATLATAAASGPPCREASAEAHAPWLVAAQQELETFAHLQPGWDGYRAGPVPRGVICQASDVLKWAAVPGVYEPIIVPTSSGSVQLEWHPSDGHSLELYVPVSGPVSAFYVHEASGVEDERVVDHSVVRELVGRLVAAI